MIKVLIIDDEKRTRDLIQKMINSFGFDIECVSQGESVQTGMQAIQEHTPDLVLLDIQMPDGTGFDILQATSGRKFKVIFFTAHEEYAIKAIKHTALDYLLKPVDHDELKNAVERAMSELESPEETNPKHIQKSLDPHKKRLVLKTLESVFVVELENIIRCEADRNYTTFFLKEGNKIVVSKTLKEYEGILSNYNFLRVHQSHLINLEFVDRYDKMDGGHVVLKDCSQVPLSPSKREPFFNILENI